ncbi:hypothetical protein ED5_3816 [Enterobacter roggenkampii]|nr:hypothetical protein ED5_3816 [Enterobacter roggenkampii]
MAGEKENRRTLTGLVNVWYDALLGLPIVRATSINPLKKSPIAPIIIRVYYFL